MIYYNSDRIEADKHLEELYNLLADALIESEESMNEGETA